MNGLTSVEAAKNIMGGDCITLQEAATIFPCRPNELSGYETIPFSEELLYFCSEPDNPYVLVPGIHHFGPKNRILTILEMKNFFSRDWPDLFALSDDLGSLPNLMIHISCLPRWYLISKRVTDKETIDRFFEKMEIGRHPNDPVPWQRENAVIYIYTWILFVLLRNEEIFCDLPFMTDDLYSPIHRTKACLEFINKKAVIAQHPPGKPIGLVACVNPYTK